LDGEYDKRRGEYVEGKPDFVKLCCLFVTEREVWRRAGILEYQRGDAKLVWNMQKGDMPAAEILE
jgi:hypothetical protein